MKRNRGNWRTFVRGLTCLLVPVCICAMLLPMPVSPQAGKISEKDTSEPFPCQNRPCGCRSASQCWEKCCCFSDEQKVAWAKANHVKVPEFVLAKVQNFAEVQADSDAADVKHQKNLTSTRSVRLEQRSSGRTVSSAKAVSSLRSCCDDAIRLSAGNSIAGKIVVAKHDDRNAKVVRVHTELCAAAAEKGDCADADRAGLIGTRTSKWVMAVYASACHGHGPFAFSFYVSILPEMLPVSTSEGCLMETCTPTSQRLPYCVLRPPVPPPKIV